MELATNSGTGVYRMTNRNNGKHYVGSAKNFNRRSGEHRAGLRRGKHCNPRLQRSWNKHGEDAFDFVIVEECSVEQMVEREQFWMDELDVCNPDKGYNIARKAWTSPVIGIGHTDETKKKMSAAKKGKPGLRTGAVLSQETKDKIAAGNRGKVMSVESCQKMSDNQKRRFEDAEERKKCAAKVHWSKGPKAEEIAAKISVGLKVGGYSEKRCQAIREGRQRQLATKRAQLEALNIAHANGESKCLFD